MPAPPFAKGNLSRPAAAANVHAAVAADVFYPSSDGKPMAENMWQSRAILHTAGDLEAAHPEALVAADILVYPEEGNPYNRIAPDVLVAFGLPTHNRSSYRVWEEGKPPDWVLEVASPSTEENDRCSKRDAYAAMGVQEYWLFDPKGNVYPPGTPRLQGLELANGKYQPLKSRLADGKRLIRSKALRLDVYVDVDGELLRFRDPATGRDIQHRHEVEAAADQARAAVEQAEARAEREAARAEHEAVRRKTSENRAEQEAARAEQEAARASREAAARSAAEARVAELEAALRRSQAALR